MALFVASTLTFVYNIEGPRICFACGSTKTNKLRQWYNDKKGGYWCKYCRQKLVDNPKHHPLTNSKRISFKGKRIFLRDAKESSRKGICKWCGAVKGQIDVINRKLCRYTILHHDSYENPSNPIANTIEICPSCHSKHHNYYKNQQKQHPKDMGNGKMATFHEISNSHNLKACHTAILHLGYGSNDRDGG